MQPHQGTGPVRIRYGDASPHQFGDLYLAEDPAASATVILLHGGFWRAHRGLETTAPIAEDLARRGWNAWNLEYRRVGQADWRGTLDDCRHGVDHLSRLATEHPVDPARTVLLGHSAGGHLAVRTAGSSMTGVAWGVTAAVSLAGVLDLRTAARGDIGESAVREFLGGGEDDAPEAYRAADPVDQLPLGIPVRCVHGRDDERVPFELSVRYVNAAVHAGDAAALVEVPGRHMDVIDPEHPAWLAVVDVLERLEGGGLGV